MNIGKDAFATEDLVQSLAFCCDGVKQTAVFQGGAVECRVLVPLYIS